MQDRLDRMPDAMGVRRQTVEHPFGTLKAWMGSTHFLTRTLDKVRTEVSLLVLAYNLNDHDLRCGTTDGGDQDLIASFKPYASVDLSGIPIVLPGNTAHRPASSHAFSHSLGRTRSLDRYHRNDCPRRSAAVG
jgi:hypothetical protein